MPFCGAAVIYRIYVELLTRWGLLMHLHCCAFGHANAAAQKNDHVFTASATPLRRLPAVPAGPWVQLLAATNNFSRVIRVYPHLGSLYALALKRRLRTPVEVLPYALTAFLTLCPDVRRVAAAKTAFSAAAA